MLELLLASSLLFTASPAINPPERCDYYADPSSKFRGKHLDLLINASTTIAIVRAKEYTPTPSPEQIGGRYELTVVEFIRGVEVPNSRPGTEPHPDNAYSDEEIRHLQERNLPNFWSIYGSILKFEEGCTLGFKAGFDVEVIIFMRGDDLLGFEQLPRDRKSKFLDYVYAAARESDSS